MRDSSNPSGYVPYELAASIEDIELLAEFYHEVYTAEFPDINERESMENMGSYLRLKAQGWYGKNDYHILLLLSGGRPVAGSIIDYLATPNAGVIEFLVVDAGLRNAGLGARLLQWTEDILRADSRKAGHADWDFVIGEMNDPFKSDASIDSIDPFARAMIWHRWGYRKLRFPYVQPALSADKAPVSNLLLMCRPGPARDTKSIPSAQLREAVYGYIKWAMRIDAPEDNDEYRGMARYLATLERVEMTPLANYVADESVRRLRYKDAIAEQGEDLDAILDSYSQAFQPGRTSVDRDIFRQFLSAYRREESPYAFHLLAIKSRPAGPARGMASFFTFPRAGFGGYLALGAGIKGKGHLAEVISVIERHMVEDRMEALGWFIECDPGGDAAAIFKRRGFHELGIRYHQPPLWGATPYTVEQAPVLRLMYKPMGENFGMPSLATQEFLHAMRWIYRVAYRIDRPETNAFYLHVAGQLEAGGSVRWGEGGAS